MYNEKLKSEFVSQYTKSEKTATVAIRAFNAVQKYEEELGSDLCTMSTEELQPIMDKILGARSASKLMYLTIFREYVKWCGLSQYPGVSDGIMGVNTVGLDKIKAQMVSGPLNLQRVLDAIYDRAEDETVDIVFRCNLWMAFSGLDEEDAIAVRTGDVDLKNMQITAGGKKYPIYREAIPAFRCASEKSSFLYRHPLYSGGQRPRTSGDQLLRGFRSDAQIVKMRSDSGKKNAAAIEKGSVTQKLTYGRVWLSGVFYRMSEWERSGGDVNFAELAVSTFSGKSTDHAAIRYGQNLKARGYLADYQRWKLAFSI